MQNTHEFPMEHLPSQLNNIVRTISGNTQAPIGLVAGTCLGAISLASQALVKFQYPDGRTSSPSLYSVIIAESGERKTAVYHQVMKPILEFEQESLKMYAEKMKIYEADRMVWMAVNKSLLTSIRKKEEQGRGHIDDQEKLRKHYLEKPIPPKLPKLIYNDATHEAIVKGLSENMGSAGLISDEGGSVLNGRAINNFPLFNQLWDGAPYTVERKDHREIINNCHFSILALTQLNELNHFIQKRGERAVGNGFFARCLWLSTATTQGQRQNVSEARDDSQYVDKFHQRMRELLALTLLGGPVKVLKFSPEAENRFLQFQNALENQIRLDRHKHPALAGILSKIPENTVRLATLIHFFFEFDGDEIGGDMLDHMIPVAQYYYHQVVTLLTVRMDKSEEDAKNLYQWLLQGPINARGVCTQIAKTHVRRYAPYQLRDGVRLNKALKILEEYGNISLYKQRNSNGSIHQVIEIHRR